mgnify:CR=1 FL=1
MAIDGPAGPDTVSVALPGCPTEDLSGDAALAAGLLPAMVLGEDLHVEGTVSTRLLRQATTIQSIWSTWDRTLHPLVQTYRCVAVTAYATTSRRPEPSPTRGTACFFTLGVDSFHSAVAHREELDALVYVHGFDVPLSATSFRAEVSERLRDAAALLGLPLLEIETDLRALGDQTGVVWPEYHGAALATIALLLAPRFSRVLVPATHTYGHLEGLGSHPLLDPLWSTDEVEVVHDGADATRVDKVRAVAGEEAARRHLRVCWENPDGAYNCGRCEKCVRTGVAIRIAGVEGRFDTVPPPSLRTVATTLPTGRGSEWADLRDDLRRSEPSPRLGAAIALARARHRLARTPVASRWFG